VKTRLSVTLAVLIAATVALPSAAGAAGLAPIVTLSGTLAYAHGEGPSEDMPHRHVAGQPDTHGALYSYWTLTTDDGQAVSLSFARGVAPDGFLNGARVRVNGARTGAALAVGAGVGDARVLRPVSASTTTAAATVTKTVLVLLVNFVANPAQPYTIDQTVSTTFTAANSVAGYFAEESNGGFAMTGDVRGYYTIDFDTAGCNYTDLGNKARAAASLDGVNLSAYTQIQYVFPYLSSCGWAGLAYLPGRDSFINQYLGLRVQGHELSHNFGVHHASSYSCTTNGVRVSLSATASDCTQSEYGDPFSIMGSASTRWTHGQQLATLGFLPTGQRMTVTTAGTYTLGAIEDVSAATRVMRIARPGGTYLYLDLRMPVGQYYDNFSASDPAVTGVSIRISNDWGTIIQSKLIDATPETASFSDAPLPVGRTFTDPVAGVNVTLVSVDAAAHTARVAIDWLPDEFAPSQPGAISVSANGASGANLSWGASTDNVAVTGYRVYRDGVLRSTTTATSFADTGLTGGQAYAYAVTAIDGAGNESTAATKAWTQPSPDTTPPTAPSNLRVSSLTKARATLAWNASTDAAGVAGYRVYRNGVLVATVTTLSWSDTRKTSASTYYVVAYDAAGNVSLASNSVTVPKK
jgi:chitodextrinase